MKKIGFLKSCWLVFMGNRMSPHEIQSVQTQRLKDLIAYARERSPYFRDLYKNLGENPSYESLPVTTKSELMTVFDRWVTDPTITKEKINAFMMDEDNIGRMFEKKCYANYTSGSTGLQCLVLTDKTTENFLLSLNCLRSFSSSASFIKSILKGAKFTSILAPGFYIEHNQIRSQMLSFPLHKYRTQTIDIANSTSDIVSQLNDFRPSILSTYPSVTALLLPEIKAGRLKIKPDIVIIGGENSTPQLKEDLRKTLKCSVYDNYGATECGVLAFECPQGHLHINSDWVILEAVDKNNNPVPPGVCSDKVLLTNLFNYLQPIIRYEMTDRVIMHDTPCKCGTTRPYLSVEGRTDDTLEFESISGPVQVVPFNLMPDSDLEGLLRYQLVQKDPNTLEMRLHCVDDASRENTYIFIRNMILHHLEINQIFNIKVYLSDTLPQLVTKSGKFKSVYKERPIHVSVIHNDEESVS